MGSLYPTYTGKLSADAPDDNSLAEYDRRVKRLEAFFARFQGNAQLEKALRGALRIDPQLPRLDSTQHIVFELPVPHTFASGPLQRGELTVFTLAPGSGAASNQFDEDHRWSYNEILAAASPFSYAAVIGTSAVRASISQEPELVTMVRSVEPMDGTIQRIGFTDNTTPVVTPANGYYWEAAGNGNWCAVARRDNIETRIDTGVAQVTEMPQELRIAFDGPQRATFKINGVQHAEILGGLPAVSSRMSPGMAFINAAGVAERRVNWNPVFYIRMRLRGVRF